MFKVHCHVHGSDVLLDWSRVEAMRNTAAGPVLDWHCWCGARGSLVHGRSLPRTTDPAVVDITLPAVAAG
ncbi:MAG TPA: hypothetical protein VFI47_18165 [Acidimicrobiales bacterium]|nr:hypothetical protein [Acidimicrobiales bacterium]